MTPDKRVEEIMEMIYTEIKSPTSQGKTNIKNKLEQTLTQYHQDMMSEVKSMKKAENVTSEIESEYEYQVRNNRCIGYNQAIDDIISSLSK